MLRDASQKKFSNFNLFTGILDAEKMKKIYEKAFGKEDVSTSK